MKFGELLQVMIAQILKKEKQVGVTSSKAFSECEARKKKKKNILLLLTYDESGAVDRVLQNNFVAA